MLYTERNAQGDVIAIRNTPQNPDQKPASEDELYKFLSTNEDIASYQTLLTLLDTRIVRVLDDLIDVLVNNNVIRFTDLPEDAQKKLGNRKSIRKKMQDEMQLMLDDDDIL